MKVIKRDGKIVDFDRQKIKNAILSAFKAVDKEITEYAESKARNISEYIEALLEDSMEITNIETIQDYVEKGLMATKRKDVAKAYILYRNNRESERNKKTELRKKINEKLKASNIQNQNANVDEYSFGGRIGEANNILLKDIAINEILSPLSKYNHIYNRIYIHDLSHYVVGDHNCLTMPLDDLLKNGFKTRQTDVRPAQSVNTAYQLVAVLFQLQSLVQFGGVSSAHFDWTMVPYVRKSFYKYYCKGLRWCNNYSEEEIDKFKSTFSKEQAKDISIEDKRYYNEIEAYNFALEFVKEEISQATEGLFHNLNTLQSRSGNQLPFSSINLGTCTLLEGRMVIKAFLEKIIEGTGKFGRTSIFPCSIFQSMKGVNRKPEDKNYDLFRLALKATAQRLYPNYCNIEWSGNNGFDRADPKTYAATMGCRTNTSYDINGLGLLKDGRGNICPVTIIMPTLAMEAISSISDNNSDIVEIFMKILENAIEDAKEMLIERFEYIASQDLRSAKFMYENNIMVGYDPKLGIKSALIHGTLAIGQIGLAETLQLLIGCNHTTKEGMEIAKRIEQLFKDKCSQYKEQYKLNFGVYYTPAENLCYTAMKQFQYDYGIIPNVSDKDFFTNSIHVPVWEEMSPFDKIDIESQLTGYSSAGCITYVELDGGAKNNIDALEQIVLYAMDKDIPYFAINVPSDSCLDCGYNDEINEECPKCKSKNVQHLRRVTGYLTGSYEQSFNLGKQQEVKLRVKHKKFNEEEK